MRRAAYRPNAYKHDVQAHTWWQEVRAWLVVMLTILGLWLLYQYFETDASSAPTYQQRRIQV